MQPIVTLQTAVYVEFRRKFLSALHRPAGPTSPTVLYNQTVQQLQKSRLSSAPLRLQSINTATLSPTPRNFLGGLIGQGKVSKMSQYQHFPKLFDSKTNFHVTLLKNGFSADTLMLPKKPSKPTILQTKEIKLEPEVQIQEGSEPLKFNNEDLPVNGRQNGQTEIGSKEIVVKNTNVVEHHVKKKEPEVYPHIEIIGE